MKQLLAGYWAGCWFGVQLCALQNRLAGNIFSRSTCCSGRWGKCCGIGLDASHQHSPFPRFSAWILGAVLGNDTWLHLPAEAPLLLKPFLARLGHAWCLLGSACCTQMQTQHLCVLCCTQMYYPAPGLHQAAPRFPVFAVASALPKPCCCPVGTGAGCCFWCDPEGDVPTACTQGCLMVEELSTCLLPLPRENSCFLNRGADDVVKMSVFLLGFFLLLLLFWFGLVFNRKSERCWIVVYRIEGGKYLYPFYYSLKV